MGIYAPMATGLPHGVTEATIGDDRTVSCAGCDAAVDVDRAVHAMGTTFCGDDCLWDWTADHRDEVLERLRD